MSAKITVIPPRKISQPAQGIKEGLAMFAECCNTIQGCAPADVRKDSAFRLGIAIQTLLCYATPEAFQELFGELPPEVLKHG